MEPNSLREAGLSSTLELPVRVPGLLGGPGRGPGGELDLQGRGGSWTDLADPNVL